MASPKGILVDGLWEFGYRIAFVVMTSSQRIQMLVSAAEAKRGEIKTMARAKSITERIFGMKSPFKVPCARKRFYQFRSDTRNVLPIKASVLLSVFGLGFPLILSACHKTASLPPSVENTGLLKSASLLIGTLSKNTASVVRIYPGPDGLVGVIFKTREGTMRVVWMTPHGAAIVVGPVITAAGQDLTRISQQAVDAVSKVPAAGRPSSDAGRPSVPDANSSGPADNLPSRKSPLGKKMSAADFLLMSRHLKSIAVGSGSREIWVYFDPNCIFCNRLYEELKPYRSQVRAHWIPVGFLKKDDSLRKATGILQSRNPAEALLENEDRFDSESEEGGYPLPEKLDPAVEVAVNTNAIGLGQATGALSTPTIVYRGTDGKPHSVMGLPPDLRAFLEGVKR